MRRIGHDDTMARTRSKAKATSNSTVQCSIRRRRRQLRRCVSHPSSIENNGNKRTERGRNKNNTRLPSWWRMWFLPRQLLRCSRSFAIAHYHEILRRGPCAISNGNKRSERGGSKNNTRLPSWWRRWFLPKQVLCCPHSFAIANCHEILRRGS